MLKTIVLLLLIVFPPTLQQRMAEGEGPDLAVVKFSWAKERQNSDLIRGAQNPAGRMTTPISNDRDLESRKAEMRNATRKSPNTVGDPGDGYRLVLEVKNEGTRIVKTLIWEFRQTAGPDDYEPRQYLCALQVKPNKKKTLSQWTPFAPVKVVSVAARSDALKDGEVIINRIEYADGSVWKKRGWNYVLPPDSSKQVSEGKCSVF